MTEYNVDGGGVLMRRWQMREGQSTEVVLTFPRAAVSRQSVELAAALTQLSQGLWHLYSQSGIGQRGSDLRGRRRRLVEALDKVVAAVRPSTAGMRGPLREEDAYVEQLAERVNDALVAFVDVEIQEAVIAEVEAEVSTVDRADRGWFSGRASQATLISRAFVGASQLKAADTLLGELILDPSNSAVRYLSLACTDRLDRMDPTAMAVCALRWFVCAVDALVAMTGKSREHAVAMADFFEELPLETLQSALQSIDSGRTSQDAALEFIWEGLEFCDRNSAFARVTVKVPTKLSGSDAFSSPVPAQPTRPAHELLAGSFSGISACRHLFGFQSGLEVWPDDYDELGEDERECIAEEIFQRVDEAFIEAIRSQVEKTAGGRVDPDMAVKSGSE